MKRELMGIRPVVAIAAASVAVAAAAAGCSSSGGTAGSSPGTHVSTKQALAGKSPANPLAKSHMRVLTTLHKAQLCSVLTTAQAGDLLHGAAAAPVYADHRGVAVSCQWTRQGASAQSGEQLWVAIPAATDWKGTKLVDKVLHSRSVKVDGHRALAATRRGQPAWAEVDVALGNSRDPVADFRAPTLTEALKLAQLATPHILALG
jgi:hypothetical protein